MSCKIKAAKGIKVITFERLEELGFISHGFSTREGGYSSAPYNSLNLGLKTEDNQKAVLNNTKRFCAAVDVDFESLAASDQVHKDKIHIVTEADKGKGYTRERDYSEVDALITNVRGVPLISFYADCVPLYFVDPGKKVIALAHAGWKGTALKIGSKVVSKMVEEFNSDPREIIAVIGPSIGVCCYEVDKEVIGKFNKNFTDTSAFAFQKDNGRYMIDLWKANKMSLEEIGLSDRNIELSKLCTGCDTSRFFSHRMEGPFTGRMASIIQLN